MKYSLGKHLMLWLAALGLLALAATPGFARDRDKGIARAGADRAERRVALVVGNADYHGKPLRNPVNDARDLARLLRSLGFQVTVKFNLSQTGLKKAIDAFGREIRKSGVGLFFFSGHGAQVDGRNYLIPIGANMASEEDVEYEAVDAGRVLAKMQAAANRMNIVILDACRDNPFTSGFRSTRTGLAAVKAPRGTIVAYAAAPGERAADGTGRNSPFTKALLTHLATPGLGAVQAFQRVQVEVADNSAGRQSPWLGLSPLKGQFYFKPGKGQAVAPPAPSQVRQPIQVADSPGPAPEVDKRKLRIRELLRQAEVDLAADRLTSPAGNNALERYRAVLELEPANEAANAGIRQIVARYVKLAEGRIAAKDWQRAESYLARAEKISEGDPRVLALRDKLIKVKKGAQAAAEAERKGRAAAEAARRSAERVVERSSDGRFTKSASGIITDRRTGLQWYEGPDKDTNWKEAKRWIESLLIGGGGWRMPTKSESAGLWQDGVGSRNRNPIFMTKGWLVWTSETDGSSIAYDFNFNGGKDNMWLRFYGEEYAEGGARAFAVRSRR